jgi:hypothetical protein
MITKSSPLIEEARAPTLADARKFGLALGNSGRWEAHQFLAVFQRWYLAGYIAGSAINPNPPILHRDEPLP